MSNPAPLPAYRSPAEEFAHREFTPAELGLRPARRLQLGHLRYDLRHPPTGFAFRADLGVLVPDGMHARRLQGWPPPFQFSEAPRIIVAANGDWIVGFPAGMGHQFAGARKLNDLYLVRSTDRGRTWTPPRLAWGVLPYNQHAFNPLRPRGSDRIYTFQQESTLEITQRSPHSGPLAYRYSDDHGHSWSAPQPIRPTNDPDYWGVCHMQMAETSAGTWLLGTYTVEVQEWADQHRTRRDIQYVLRSVDQGRTWTLVPGPRPGGWKTPGTERMLEGLILPLPGARAVMFTRSTTGRIWEMRSADDGLSWSAPTPTTLVHPDAPPMIYALPDGRLAAFIHNRPASDPHWNRGYDDRRALWFSQSKDEGRTWDEPRLLTADICEPGDNGRGWIEVGYADLHVDGGEFHLFFSHQKRQILQLTGRIDDLAKLPTQADLARPIAVPYASPHAAHAGRVFSAAELDIQCLDTAEIGGHRIGLQPAPPLLEVRPELGIVVAAGVPVQRVHAWPAPDSFCECPRALRTRRGDFLCLFVAGAAHQYRRNRPVNATYAIRSTDRGRTWSAPRPAWSSPYNQHAANLFQPAGQRRILAFQMEAIWSEIEHPHAAPLAVRQSDDDGETWSEPRLIRPVNDPGYRGVCHMQMAQTSGAWLLPTYTPIDDHGVRRDRQYVLRSTDEGATWTLLPGPRPAGWTVPHSARLMEGEIVALGGPKALLYSRESSGHLWEQRTDDDGLTWTAPAPTPRLVHPDAPPMVYRLADGRTLVSFVHNRPASDRFRNAGHGDRQELWVALSTDEGRSWSEPRFLAANIAPAGPRTFRELSYADLLVDGEQLHLFLDEEKRQILHFRLEVDRLTRLPDAAALSAVSSTSFP
jgi:predicted neuraminidase